METRLNSPKSKMADDMSEFTQSGQFVFDNVAKKRRKIGHKCCSAARCNNRSDNRPDLSFHLFPKDEEIRRKWEVAMKRDDKEFKHINNKFCCSEHFVPSDFKSSLTGHRREIKKGTVPSVFEWKAAEKCSERSERVTARKEQKEVKERERLSCQYQQSLSFTLQSKEEGVVLGPLTLEDHINSLNEEIEQLKVCIRILEEKEAISKFGLERFAGSDEDINFYTGFPCSKSLQKLWEYIEHDSSHLTYYSYVRDRTDPNTDVCFPYLNQQTRKFSNDGVGAKRTLKPVDEFWLVLCRLRLGLFEKDLAHRFNVSVATVSDIIITWCNFLYIVLGGFPCWISREIIKEYLPEAFRGKFENVRCIIDCTEIKVEKPQSLDMQSEFYSEYKSHNTYKGLVGISPNVWVTFVSQLYGGNISDREIVEKSHLIDFVEPTDLLMADRGFEIKDLLALKRAQIYIPPKRQSSLDQFSKEDCFETMRIANVRIHVERAIRRVKGWHVFDQVLPLSMNGVVNQMWTVCCLLVNWQKPALTG